MEKQIKRVTAILKIQFFLFWLFPILLFAAFEADLLPVGVYAADAGKQYLWETAGILLTIVCVPLALKLFSIVLKKKIDTLAFPAALERYSFWSGVRLGLLEITVLLNIVIYYMTLNNIGGLCALIGLTASAFCLPGEKRLRDEVIGTSQ